MFVTFLVNSACWVIFSCFCYHLLTFQNLLFQKFLSGLMFCRSRSWSKLFAKIISRRQKLPLARKELQVKTVIFYMCRYKQEIVRLRKQLGQEEDSAMVFTDRSRGKGRYRRH